MAHCIPAVITAILLVACVHANLVSPDRQLQLVPLLTSSVTTSQGILGYVQLYDDIPGSANRSFVSVCDLPTHPTWSNAAAQVACKTFGYTSGVALLGPVKAYTSAVFDLNCTGSEATLASCPFKQAGTQQACRSAVIACTGPSSPNPGPLSPQQLVGMSVGITLGAVALLAAAGWALARAWQRRQQLAHPTTSGRHHKRGQAASSNAAAEEAAAIALVVVGGGRRNSLDKPRQGPALPPSIPGGAGRSPGRTSIDVSAAVLAAQRAASMAARPNSTITRQLSHGKEGGPHPSSRRNKQEGSNHGSSSGNGAHPLTLLHQQQHPHGSGSHGSHRRTSESCSSKGSGRYPPTKDRRTSTDSNNPKAIVGPASDPGGTPGDPAGVSPVTHGDRVAARVARLAASWKTPASDSDEGEQQSGTVACGAAAGAGCGSARAAAYPEAIPEDTTYRSPSQRSSTHMPGCGLRGLPIVPADPGGGSSPDEQS